MDLAWAMQRLGTVVSVPSGKLRSHGKETRMSSVTNMPAATTVLREMQMEKEAAPEVGNWTLETLKSSRLAGLYTYLPVRRVGEEAGGGGSTGSGLSCSVESRK